MTRDWIPPERNAPAAIPQDIPAGHGRQCPCAECCFIRARLHATRLRTGRHPQLEEAKRVELPERTMRQLLVAGRNAVKEFAEIAKLAGIPTKDIKQFAALTSAIFYAEKACGKRANEMSAR